MIVLHYLLRDRVETNNNDDNSVRHKQIIVQGPPARSNRHVHGLFTCSNYPNVEARASAILAGTSKQLLL